jgi:hypothetical protein
MRSLPGIPGLFFLLTMIIFVIYPFSPSFFFRDGDSVWLIKTGLYIVDHGQLPRQDVIFGNVIPRDWVHYQWGFELLLGSAYKWAGLNGVVFFCSVLIAATILVICFWLFERGFQGPSVAFVGLVSFVALLVYASVRPFLITNLFTVLLLYLLEKRLLRDPQRLALIPLLFFVWANLHLGFVGGFLILTLFIGFKLPTVPGKERLVLLMTLGLSLLATMINPYGFHLYAYFFQLAQSSGMMEIIAELHSPNFHKFPFMLFHILFIVAALIYIHSDRRLTEIHYLFLLLGLGFGLYSLRHYYLFVFASAPVAAAFFERVTVRLPLVGDDQKKYLRRWEGKNASIVIITLLIGALVTQTGIYSFRFSEDRFPVQAVRFLKDHPLTGPIFTGGQWGSYLAWDSGHRALLDSRFDMYGDDYVKDYYAVYDFQKDWRPFFETHKVRRVLLPADSVLSRVLQADSGSHWEISYEDSQAILLQRQTPSQTPSGSGP